MSKLRILCILHMPPPVHGAAMVGKYIENSDVINSILDFRYINLGTSTSVDDIGRSGITKLFRYLKLLGQVAAKMISFRPRKVYLTLTAQGPGFYKDALVVFLAKMLGGHMVYHFHNKGIQTRQDKPFDNWLYKKVFKNADVILLSEHLYADVEKYVPRERVHLCPNGIPEQGSSITEHHKEVEDKPVQLLFLSNLIESKGVFVLLEACKVLKREGVFFQCIYVGDEGDVSSNELNKKIADLGLQKQVTYVGKKYNKEKEEVFVASDIFVHPSWNDCFPLVLLEAMQAKLPIISTLEGGIPEMVKEGKNGFLVPQKDAEALAEKLELLICNPEIRERMGEAGHDRYKEYFTLKAFENRFANIIKKISVH